MAVLGKGKKKLKCAEKVVPVTRTWEPVGVRKLKSMMYGWCTNKVGASNKLLIKYTQCKPVLPDKLIPAAHTIACHYHVFVSAVLRMVYT